MEITYNGIEEDCIDGVFTDYADLVDDYDPDCGGDDDSADPNPGPCASCSGAPGGARLSV